MDCRDAARRVRRRVADTVGNCARCGATFTARRSDARFCSTGCRVAAHRHRRTRLPADHPPAGVMSGDERRAAAEIIRTRHYTRSVPAGKSWWVGYEDAIVVWSIPANPYLAKFVLQGPGTVWELSRLWAPDGHRPNLLTEAIGHAVRVLRSIEDVDAVVSYADPSAGHHGGVYRAASWRPHGRSESRAWRSDDGAIVARRSFHSGSRFLTKPEVEALGYVEVSTLGKIRFVRPLTRRAKRQIVWPPDGSRRP